VQEPLFVLVNGERKVSHFIVADYCNLSSDAILKFLNVKSKEFEALGVLTYEETSFEDEEGFMTTKVCYLSIPQIKLLLHYLKKTDEVKSFVALFNSTLRSEQKNGSNLSLKGVRKFAAIGVGVTLAALGFVFI